MPRDIHLLTNQTADIAPAASGVAVVQGGEFVVKVWSPSADWDTSTVTIYIIAIDGTAIPLQAFTEDGAYFGRVGQIESLRAGVAGTTAAADLTVTVSQ